MSLDAEIFDDPGGTDVYKDEAGEWRWRIKAPNGEIVVAASEGFTERNDAIENLQRVREALDDQP